MECHAECQTLIRDTVGRDEGTTRKGWKDTGHFKECKSCPILSHPFILIIPNLSDRSLTQDMKQSRQNSFSSK